MDQLMALRIQVKRPVARPRLDAWQERLDLNIAEANRQPGNLWAFNVLFPCADDEEPLVRTQVLCRTLAAALLENARGAEAQFGPAIHTGRGPRLDESRATVPFRLEDGPPRDERGPPEVSRDHWLKVRNILEDYLPRLRTVAPENQIHQASIQALLAEAEEMYDTALAELSMKAK